MGYTHYWKQDGSPKSAETFNRIGKDFTKVFPFIKAQVGIESGFADKDKPPVEEYCIWLNGEGKGAEDFYFPLYNYTDLDFCKTRQLPYDLAVVVALSIAKVHLGHDIHIGTDGEDRDWRRGIELCSNILGHEYDHLDITDRGKLRFASWNLK